MESVKSVAKNISRKLYALSLRLLRNLIWRADEWVHAQEQKLKAPAIRAEYAAEVDPVASAARERTHKRLGARHPDPLLKRAGEMASIQPSAKIKLPRLHYEQGSWVRQ